LIEFTQKNIFFFYTHVLKSDWLLFTA
jgi:hypothetical protein